MSKTKNDFNEKNQTIQMDKKFNDYNVENQVTMNNAGGQLNDKLTELEKETIEFQNNLYTEKDETNIIDLDFNDKD